MTDRRDDFTLDQLANLSDHIWNAAIEEAAKRADPPLMHRKGAPGLWRLRRVAIATEIRALKRPIL